MGGTLTIARRPPLLGFGRAAIEVRDLRLELDALLASVGTPDASSHFERSSCSFVAAIVDPTCAVVHRSTLTPMAEKKAEAAMMRVPYSRAFRALPESVLASATTRISTFLVTLGQTSSPAWVARS